MDTKKEKSAFGVSSGGEPRDGTTDGKRRPEGESESAKKSEAVARGEQILAGEEVSVEELLELVGDLKKQRRFGLARKLLDRHADAPVTRPHGDPKVRLKFAQQRSLCTYKDPDLPAELRFDRALAILDAADPLLTSTNQETLGQAGAIHKRRWDQSGLKSELETSLAYYLRGYEQGVAKDYGYTAVNAAFVLDLLADSERTAIPSAGAGDESADLRREQARRIREDVVATLPPLLEQTENIGLRKEWWFLVTMGEACFGLGQYDDAARWLRQAAVLPHVPDWEWETTARQIVAVWRMQEKTGDTVAQTDRGAGERVLFEFLGDKSAVASMITGKVGLALSGGGFRASLFHIGVLTKLAELDLLRNIEYLWCVSGGSIIGAHYYLEVRHLLQTKTDQEITREDYIDIVRRIERDFLAGVQRNIRTRIAAEWLTNLKMIFLPDYSRTLRAGDLYESEIYRRVQDGEGHQARWLNELFVRPKGDEDCVPKDNNWRRTAKVPILILNATSLNTGHNWQFTASWMGEPPAAVDTAINTNYRLRRMYYHQLPSGRRQIRLGHAVAASACVPGLFEPLSLPGLYERDLVVRLVDGGVHDNQGTAALIEEGCHVLLVSDASGQMESQDYPHTGILGVPLRANTVLQARVRSAQFRELDTRRRSGLLRGLMFLHLKKGLQMEQVDWKNCQDKSNLPRLDPLLPYGIQRAVQQRLAATRTDLDSFSEAEACALMTSGYCMTEHALKKPILGFPTRPGPRLDWEFLKILPLMQEPGEDTTLMRQLRAADRLAFRIWLLSRFLRVAGSIALVGLVGVAGWFGYQWRAAVLPSFSIGWLLLGLLGVVVFAVLWKAIGKKFRSKKPLQSILIGVVLGTVGWPLARLHLHVFDRWFQWQGRLARLHGNQP